MAVFTGRGDDGTSGILGEGRFPKSDFRFEVVGSLDEASAALGLARAHCRVKEISKVILDVQRDLYWMMAELAADNENAHHFKKIDSKKIAWLEGLAHHYSSQAPVTKDFIVPGDSVESAALDVARTMVRKAERRVVAFSEQGGTSNSDLVRYLNRLSSLLYTLELVVIHTSGKEGPSLAKQP